MTELALEEDKKEFVKVFLGVYFDSEKEASIYFRKHKKRLILLKENNKICGFLTYLYQYSHYANIIEDICVINEHRGKNYSYKLLNKFIEISRAQKTKNSIALSSTDESNVASQKMHEGFGFKKIGTLKGIHYGKDEFFYSYDLD